MTTDRGTPERVVMSSFSCRCGFFTRNEKEAKEHKCAPPSPSPSPPECWKKSSFGEDFCGVHTSEDWPCRFVAPIPPETPCLCHKWDGPCDAEVHEAACGCTVHADHERCHGLCPRSGCRPAPSPPERDDLRTVMAYDLGREEVARELAEAEKEAGNWRSAYYSRVDRYDADLAEARQEAEALRMHSNGWKADALKAEREAARLGSVISTLRGITGAGSDGELVEAVRRKWAQ